MGMMSEFKEFAVKEMCSTWRWESSSEEHSEKSSLRGQ